MDGRAHREGCAGWFKWIVGTIVGLLGAGGGIVALISLVDANDPPPPPTPIVITVNTGSSSTETVTLPENVYVPKVVPTPIPVFNEPNANRPSEQDVADFLSEAVLAETAAYLYLDSSYVSWYFTGELLSYMEAEINQLLTDGVIVAKLYDASRSYIDNIHFVNDYRIEVDSCETWSQEFYSLWDSSFLGSEVPALYPQTIVIEQFTDGWYITDVLFYDAPAFCR